MSIDQVVNAIGIAIDKLPYMNLSMDKPKIRRRRCNAQDKGWQMT
jgi:hypothetical protein